MKVSKALVYRMITTMVEDHPARDALIAELGVEPGVEGHPLDEMVPVAQLNAAHHHIARYLNDDFASWRFGFLFEPDSIGILGYLWRHTATLEDMMDHHVKYLGLLMDVVSATFLPVDGGRRIEWRPDPRWVRQDPIGVQREHEAAIGFFSKAMQVMTGLPLMPKSITFQRSRPAAFPESFRPYLDVSTFDEELHSITFHDADLRRPLVSHNPHILSTLQGYAADVLEALDAGEGDLPSQVEETLIRSFSGSFLQIHEVAEMYNMSARNLQRHLSEAGTSFRRILNDVKLSLAKTYLNDRELSVSEIAFILGYAELPAFIRFFRKHTGLSPGDFRR